MEKYEYFDISEFDCKETGDNEMQPHFIRWLDIVRALCEFPFVITSGYRSPKHSKEIVKLTPGQHTKGIAADIRVSGGAQRYFIVKNALEHGAGGIGVAKDFVHVDLRSGVGVMWVY